MSVPFAFPVASSRLSRELRIQAEFPRGSAVTDSQSHHFSLSLFAGEAPR
jgi:hypothetical protein